MKALSGTRSSEAMARAEDEATIDQLLNENPELVTPQLVELLDQVMEQAAARGQGDLDGRLGDIKSKVQAKLIMGA